MLERKHYSNHRITQLISALVDDLEQLKVKDLPLHIVYCLKEIDNYLLHVIKEPQPKDVLFEIIHHHILTLIEHDDEAFPILLMLYKQK